MITLYGMALSNYQAKVKLALLEKGMPFDENGVPPSQTDEALLASSPLGKIPFLRTPHGSLAESQVIVEYLEAIQPEPRLLPTDPFAAAKVRELTTFIDLHLELVARDLYPQAFFGGQVSESQQARVRKLLTRNVAGFRRLARFGPYVAGDSFTFADCAAYAHLPVIAKATKLVLGNDLLQEGGVDWRTYIALIGQRPSAQRLNADRKAAPPLTETLKSAAPAPTSKT